MKMASSILATMDPVSKQRYQEKLLLLNGLDPYKIPNEKWTTDTSCFPNVTYHHIFGYLVLKKSFCTSEEFGAYKGLDAFNQAYNGWVKELRVYQPPGCHNVVLAAKVLHSMRLNEKATEPWIIISNDGDVCAAHCTCMAGLGEVCTHIATILFYVEITNRVTEKVTVTGRPAYWKPPCSKNVSESKKASDIDFTAAQTQRRIFLKEETVKTPRPKSVVPGLSSEQQQKFLEDISSLNCVVLSVISGFQDPFIPNRNLPVSLCSFKNEEMVGQPFPEITAYCNTLNYSCSTEQAISVEQETHGQSATKLWHRMREGRITASKFHSVCHTSLLKPAKSLLQTIVGSSNDLSAVKAVQWGAGKENFARSKYMEHVSSSHLNLSCRLCGLFISTDEPYIAGSPDGILNCDCCGQGCLEIKCPYSAKDMTIFQAVESLKDFCLKKTDEGVVLKTSHPYFFQIQCLMFCTQCYYCDFFVWTQKDFFVQRIVFDSDFISKHIVKCKTYFHNIVLPELVAQHFTRQVKPTPSSSQNVFCICREPEHGKMIQCDGECDEWFHLECVGVARVPRGKWFCDSCKKMKSKRKKRE